MALHQADGGQSDGQHGRGRPDDEPGESAGRRHCRGSPDLRLRRRIGGRAAGLSAPRPVFRKPYAKCRAQGGHGPRRRRRTRVRRHRALQLLSCRAENGATNAGPRRRCAADGNRRSDLLRRAARHLYDACGLRDGAQAARWRKARLVVRARRLRDKTSRAGAVARGAAGSAGAGHQRAGRGRQQSRRGAGVS